MIDGLLPVFLVAILIVGVAVFVVISLTRRGGRQLNQEDYQSRWLTIEGGLRKEDSASYQLSILAADKLLDQALKERGFSGETMGARMKAANAEFKNANQIWAAHKVRNRIAHETDFAVSHQLALRSLNAFKQALKDLGAI